MKEYQDYLLQKRKPRLYMLKNGSKDFLKKKSMLEQIATVVMNYFHSKAGNAWKMVARWAWNANCLVEATGYHISEKMIAQIS